MKIIAIDTSFEACSAAIVSNGAVLWSARKLIGKGHSEILPVMVRDALAQTGLSAAEFDRIGVVKGPGAFAGIRVGLAFARAFRLGFKANVIGVTSLEALAESAECDCPIAPVFDARRGQVYAALFDAGRNMVIEPFVAAPREAAARLKAQRTELALAGSGAALVAEHFGACRILPERYIDPVCVARIAERLDPAQAPPAPLYLRPPDAAPSKGSIFDRINGV
ncbi:MAG: tRNA (adenosine(37)-N6)-threonylcarbamoyltransferase complex dimerization subunit type 1 TsaB [Parvularculaceae bacterium]|nr:tRNA (adenosine(37)-N6)-threonylcarbamoyltransferase complex dimerization subunit type 1 TsaB [Parvularculaceae bacterium]